MLKSFLERRAEKRRLFRSLLSDTLVRKLAEAGELVVDRALLTTLGATRRELFRAAYSLAIKEKLHILADNSGKVRLLTNTRFAMETEASAFPDGRDVRPLSVVDSESEALVLEETVVLEPREAFPAVFARVEMSQADEWAGFVVADSRDKRGNLPDMRKTLPPRDRDPWTAYDEVDAPPLNVTEKK